MMNSRLLFKTSAITEILTGFALLVAPLFVIGLLLGEGVSLSGVAVSVTWLLGTALLSVGVAGWEAQGKDAQFTTRAGLCIYNVGAAIVLVIIGTSVGMNGILLWPVAIFHALIGALMLWVILSPSRNG
jgi:hypothetical protein